LAHPHRINDAKGSWQLLDVMEESPAGTAAPPKSSWLGWLCKMVFLAGVSTVVIGSLLPGQFIPTLLNDKVEHFLAYATLAISGGAVCRRRQDRLVLMLFLFTLAVGLELGQRLSPGRTADFYDAVAGWAGSCFALIPFRLTIISI
jgi:VanZ family protein